MKFNNSLKKLACLLLAILMLLGTVGCKDDGGSKKKKKIIKKRVVIVQNDDQTDNNQNNNNNNIIDNNTGNTGTDEPESRPERALPEVAEDGLVILDDPIVDEFDHEYKDLKLNSNYVIIYGLTKWNNRYEGYLNYGKSNQTERVIEYTAENKLAANDIKTWVKDNYNIVLEVYSDTQYADKVANGQLTGNEKKILVGTSDYNKNSNLAENEFEVKVEGDNLVFNGGHFAMVESAVDWFRSVEIQDGKVATLTSKENNFKSQVTIDGVTYDYVYGDEFDGYEFNDDDKWQQGTFGLERQDDMANIFDDPQFQYVENGKVRLTGDRYYDEGNAQIGYATSGEISTESTALFRNGYFEFYARLPYRRGGFPAIWTLTTSSLGKKVHNYSVDDGFGIFGNRCWDIEFDLFESFADADHMTTTIHKWYTPLSSGNGRGANIASTAQELTLEEEKMVLADQAAVKAKENQWTYGSPVLRKVDENGAIVDPSASAFAEAEITYWYEENGAIKYITETEYLALVDEDLKKIADGEDIAAADRWQNKAHQAHVRYAITFDYNVDGVADLDIFKYRLSPFTNMSKSMATYAYSFSYKGSPSNQREDPDGMYGDWCWYFNEETINNEYHLYAFHYTSDHCTVYMDGEKFLDFDWDPAYDYKDLDGDGKGDDISKNNNGVGFNLWHYFMVDMMIYTPGNFKIDSARKIQPGDCPFNLYIDYVRFYQDLDDPSMAVYLSSDVNLNK